MIYSYSIEKSSICIKKDIAKQTGFTTLTMPGLKTMLFFRKICVCHMVQDCRFS